MKYLLDTNIISAIMKGNEQVKRKAQEIIIENGDIFINGITYYEIKRGLLAVNAKTKLQLFDLLCKEFGLILLGNKVIFDRASEIYSDLKNKGQLIGDADILIASMAQSMNFILVSDNVSHFERIEGLRLENWLIRNPE